MISEETIKQAYEALAGKLTNFLISRGMEYPAACDIVQESFIRLWKKRETMEEGDSISGFIFAVAKNLQIDWYRRNKFLVCQESFDEENCGSISPPLSDDDQTYLRNRLLQALNQLPEEQRETYTLFQIAGRSIREIALLTGASESNVKVRIHRAKEKLTVLLQDLR